MQSDCPFELYDRCLKFCPSEFQRKLQLSLEIWFPGWCCKGASILPCILSYRWPEVQVYKPRMPSQRLPHSLRASFAFSEDPQCCGLLTRLSLQTQLKGEQKEKATHNNRWRPGALAFIRRFMPAHGVRLTFFPCSNRLVTWMSLACNRGVPLIAPGFIGGVDISVSGLQRTLDTGSYLSPLTVRYCCTARGPFPQDACALVFEPCLSEPRMLGTSNLQKILLTSQLLFPRPPLECRE